MYRKLIFITLALISGPAWSDPIDTGNADLDRMVNSIRSVAQVKNEIRANLLSSDECSSGGCFDNTWTGICSIVGALDIKLNFHLLHDDIPADGEKPPFPVSKKDRTMMRLIYQSCKPSNDYYWNYGTPFHVLYSPASEAIDQMIRSYVGITVRR